MKKLFIFFALLLSITPAQACLIEYIETKYVPPAKIVNVPSSGAFQQINGAAFIIVNLTNPYNYTMLNITIHYKNQSLFIPEVAPNSCFISLSYNPVYPSLFNVSLSYSVYLVNRQIRLEYTVYNDYEFPVFVKITMPRANWIRGCIGCIIGRDIIFSTTIQGKSLSSFTLIGSEEYEIVSAPVGIIEFAIIKNASMTFSASLPFSIAKGLSGNIYLANFSVINPLDIAFNTTILAYYSDGTPPHNFSDAKLLFNETTMLRPSESWSRSVSVKVNSTPAFWMKILPVNRTKCAVVAYPATNISNRFVQYGIIEGFTIVVTAPPEKSTTTSSTSSTTTSTLSTSSTTTTTSTTLTSTSTTPTTSTKTTKTSTTTKRTHTSSSSSITSSSSSATTRTETSSSKSSSSSKPYIPTRSLTYPVIFGNETIVKKIIKIIKEIITIPKIPNMSKKDYSILLSLPFFMLTTLIPATLVRNNVAIVDKAEFSPYELHMFTGRVYIPVGVRVGSILPLYTEFILPNENLKNFLIAEYRIPPNSAAAIAIALEYGGKVYLSDKRAVEIALNLGLEAYYLGGGENE